MPAAPTVPGGPNRSVQINDAGGFAGAANVKVGADGNLDVSGPISWAGQSFLVAAGDNLLVGPGTPAAATGQYNVGAGFNALSALTTGRDNVAVGNNAGRLLATGQRNTLVGSGAGENASGGNFNTLIGKSAGRSITTESYVTLLGDDTDAAPGVQQSFAVGQGAHVAGSRTGMLGPRVDTGNAVNLASGGDVARGKLDLIAHDPGLPVGIDQAAANQSAPIRQYLAPDGSTVLGQVNADGSLRLPALADSDAANGSLYFSSTQGKLAYKDSAGTIHVSGS